MTGKKSDNDKEETDDKERSYRTCVGLEGEGGDEKKDTVERERKKEDNNDSDRTT